MASGAHVEKWWMRQVRIGQTQTIIRKRKRTKKNNISPAEITPVGLGDEGVDCIVASLARVKLRVQMREIDALYGAG
jgi:hypothetical protein